MNLAFRVDSSNLIGSGHVRRCLKLAEDLRYKCNKIIFITKDLKNNFNDLIKKKKFKLVLIKRSRAKKKIFQDLNATKKICKKHAIDILVKDHYHLNSDWEKRIKRNINKLVVIDDFTKKKHHCDIIFNNLNNKNINKTKHYLGLEFVIIPSRLNKKKIKKKNTIIGTFFGSFDNANCTKSFLRIFSQKEFNKFQFISILGKNNNNKKIIKKIFKMKKNLKIVENYKKISDFINQIDILISSGGITSFEALFLNKRCINVPINFYQKTNSNFQKKMKISTIFNYSSIFKKRGKQMLLDLLFKKSNNNHFNDNKLYLDEKGSKRISEILIPSKFEDSSLVKAKSLDDCVDLFKLYNEEESIKNSFSQKKISFQKHLNWFKKKILSKNSYIYIFRINNLCVGQARFDLIKEGIALIDYSISKIFRGRGWGKLMLGKAMHEFNKKKRLKYFQAKVKKNNYKSIKIFDSFLFLKNSRGRYIEFRKDI